MKTVYSEIHCLGCYYLFGIRSIRQVIERALIVQGQGILQLLHVRFHVIGPLVHLIVRFAHAFNRLETPAHWVGSFRLFVISTVVIKLVHFVHLPQSLNLISFDWLLSVALEIDIVNSNQIKQIRYQTTFYLVIQRTVTT